MEARSMPNFQENNTDDIEGKNMEFIIGRRVRNLRLNARMTLETLAYEAGISKALASKIENGKVTSSISTYIKVARTLGVPLSELLKEAEDIHFVLVRRDEKKPAPHRKAPHGYHFESLGSHWPNKAWSPFLLTYEPVPNPPRTSPGFNYEGEEFLYILQGRLEFFCGENRYELEPGDCLFVDATISHGGRALGPEKCIALMIAIPNNP
jgi:transcriptional regulator with XRE-family HTH domain